MLLSNTLPSKMVSSAPDVSLLPVPSTNMPAPRTPDVFAVSVLPTTRRVVSPAALWPLPSRYIPPPPPLVVAVAALLVNVLSATVVITLAASRPLSSRKTPAPSPPEPATSPPDVFASNVLADTVVTTAAAFSPTE